MLHKIASNQHTSFINNDEYIQMYLNEIIHNVIIVSTFISINTHIFDLISYNKFVVNFTHRTILITLLKIKLIDVELLLIFV